MESALYGVYTLVVLYQKSHSFASLTRSFSDTPQLVCKHRTRALSMKYSIYLLYEKLTGQVSLIRPLLSFWACCKVYLE